MRWSIVFSLRVSPSASCSCSPPPGSPSTTFCRYVTGLWFFVLLSFTGIGMVLGPVEGAWLVGIGLAVIGVCHLPISLIARVAILCVAAIGMAVLRIGVGQVPWSSALWPILGSMFVFRLIIYFYDRSYETTPPRLSQTLGYFFLLPNVCFPLFPVVDFKKFCRHYYDEDRHKTYQVGIEWIWRGLLQLVLYRLIYYHLTLDPVAVTHFGEPRRLYGVDVPAVRAHLRPFSSRHRHASPVRIQPARNPSSGICWRRASPTSGGGSISTGRTS